MIEDVTNNLGIGDVSIGNDRVINDQRGGLDAALTGSSIIALIGADHTISATDFGRINTWFVAATPIPPVINAVILPAVARRATFVAQSTNTEAFLLRRGTTELVVRPGKVVRVVTDGTANGLMSTEGESQPGDQGVSGLAYNWTGTFADADPGAGGIQTDHSSFSTITAVVISETDAYGASQASLIAALDDSGSTIRATLKIESDDGAHFLFDVISANVTHSGWVSVQVSPNARTGTPSGRVGVTFSLKGDLGASGGGGGGDSTITVDATSATTYTLTSDDVNVHRKFTAATAVTVTAPQPQSIGFSPGQFFEGEWGGAGQLSFAEGDNTLIRTPETLSLAGQGYTGRLIATGPASWTLSAGQTGLEAGSPADSAIGMYIDFVDGIFILNGCPIDDISTIISHPEFVFDRAGLICGGTSHTDSSRPGSVSILGDLLTRFCDFDWTVIIEFALLEANNQCDALWLKNAVDGNFTSTSLNLSVFTRGSSADIWDNDNVSNERDMDAFSGALSSDNNTAHRIAITRTNSIFKASRDGGTLIDHSGGPGTMPGNVPTRGWFGGGLNFADSMIAIRSVHILPPQSDGDMPTLSSVSGVTVLGPTNNDFADAAALAIGDTLTSVTAGATHETDEPNIEGKNITTVMQGSVWYDFVATTAGVTISTGGSMMDTLLAVRTGTGIATLSTIAENDSDGSLETSLINLATVIGAHYKVQIDGYSQGIFTVSATDYTPTGADVAQPHYLGARLAGYDDSFAVSSLTFSDVYIGPASSDRLVIIPLTYMSWANGNTDDPMIAQLTLNGVAMSIAANVSASGGWTNSAIFYAVVPTGTTCDLVLTTNGPGDDMWAAEIAVYVATGLSSNTPHDTATDSTGSASSLTTTLDIPADGFALAAFHNDGFASAGTTSPSGFIVDRDDLSNFGAEYVRRHTASLLTGATVAYSWDYGDTDSALAVASWA